MATPTAALPPRYFLNAKKHKASLKRTHEKQDPDYIPSTTIARDSRPRKRTRRDGVVSFSPKPFQRVLPAEKSEVAPSSPDTVLPIPETKQPEPDEPEVCDGKARISKLLPAPWLPLRKRRHQEAVEKKIDSRATNRYHQTKIGICDGNGQCSVDWCCTFHISAYGLLPLADLNSSIRPS